MKHFVVACSFLILVFLIFKSTVSNLDKVAAAVFLLVSFFFFNDDVCQFWVLGCNFGLISLRYKGVAEFRPFLVCATECM